MVDCNKCKNLDTDLCHECIHGVDWLEDYYEELSKAELAKIEQEELLEAQENAITEWIEVNIDDNFRRAFEIAKKCAAEKHFESCFMGVYMEAKEMVSSNTHEMLVLSCEAIPEQLVGRIVVRLEGDRAGITDSSFPEYKHFFDTTGYTMVPFSEVELGEPEENQYQGIVRRRLSHGNFVTHLNDRYITMMQEILNGPILISYDSCKPLRPLLFAGNNGRMAIVPVRTL